jgi:hypothetical protein
MNLWHFKRNFSVLLKLGYNILQKIISINFYIIIYYVLNYFEFNVCMKQNVIEKF